MHGSLQGSSTWLLTPSHAARARTSNGVNRTTMRMVASGYEDLMHIRKYRILKVASRGECGGTQAHIYPYPTFPRSLLDQVGTSPPVTAEFVW
ncbi:hypothetical protein K466DRAFT_591194 [Polyporus arcularius HHB13444]|uniref:Uncharacterized protein n=1 Tax=Polyporus arcularius HHB13444 TaxID=1314778 RepID=A0A5C3P6V3_9APHY|nr:hypothetical protein K466DRAFT_591194 [Polyporus arcularius HHB13444]